MRKTKTAAELRKEAKAKLALAKDVEQKANAALGKRLCELAEKMGKTPDALIETLEQNSF